MSFKLSFVCCHYERFQRKIKKDIPELLGSHKHGGSTEPKTREWTRVRAVLSCFSWICLFVFSWTVVHQAPQSMRFSRQEYWSGLPCPPGIFLTQGSNPHLLRLLHCRQILYCWAKPWMWYSKYYSHHRKVTMSLGPLKQHVLSRKFKVSHNTEVEGKGEINWESTIDRLLPVK